MEDSWPLLYNITRIFVNENLSVLCLKNLDYGYALIKMQTLEGAGLRLIQYVLFACVWFETLINFKNR